MFGSSTGRVLSVIGGATAAVGMLLAAPANADPHYPDADDNICPGGGFDGMGAGYCDGIKYPDGTLWRQDYWTVPIVGRMSNLQCVANDTPTPPLAPPGGCGGEV